MTRTQGRGLTIAPNSPVKVHRLRRPQLDALLTMQELGALSSPVYIAPLPCLRVRDSAGREHLIDPDGTPVIRPVARPE